MGINRAKRMDETLERLPKLNGSGPPSVGFGSHLNVSVFTNLPFPHTSLEILASTMEHAAKNGMIVYRDNVIMIV